MAGLELETVKYKHRHDLVDKGTCWQIYYSCDHQLWYASLRPINLYKAQKHVSFSQNNIIWVDFLNKK